MKAVKVLGAVAGLGIMAGSTALLAQDAPPRPRFEEDGTVKVPAFDLKPSSFLSPEALAAQKMRARMPAGTPPNDLDIVQVRRGLEAQLAPQVAEMRKRYAVDIAPGAIAGVPVRTITPVGKPTDRTRVLINVHGGGFSMCAESCALLESIPISSLGGFKVVTVDYRMGPEARHPAAVEDVEKVYRELLKTYQPKQIGLYGCSAGGALTAQAAAWMPTRRLPQFGAVGIFGAGAVRFGVGDSAYISGYVSGSFPPPAAPGKSNGDMTRGYFDGAEMGDPILSAALHPEVIAKFPPALIITGSRAMDMSPAIVTNSALIKAGVPSTLIVQEGMDHCYIMQSNLPEARDAYQATVNFFRANLTAGPAPTARARRK
ncbi:MAG: alpha/beta hydrolase [Novosphingobium sp.]